MSIVPIVRGRYLCDRVDVHPASKNLTLHNCFRTLMVSNLPGQPAPFYVIAYLANGLGEYELKAQVYRLDTMAEIYRSWVRVSFTGRLDEIRFKLRVEQCRFPGPGEYEITLWAGNEMIAQTPFTVRQLSEDES